MVKKQAKATKSILPRLRKEALCRLDDFKIQGVFGGARLWTPGFAEDTTPTSDDTTGQ
jgi:hypothetical protein